MDKKFVMGIAAMAALTLVSCSSDDLDSFSDNSSKNEAISFDGYLGRSAVAVNGTRGSVLDKDALQKLPETAGAFGVFGNYSKEGATEGYGQNLFKNQKVFYSNSEWTYTPYKYWLPEGHIDFLAYAPYDATKTALTDSKSKIVFTVDKEIAKQKDLLWANAAGQTQANKPVTFTFNHALSRLGYTVKLKKDCSNDVTITLNKITLAGSENGTDGAFYETGTIDLAKGKKEDGLWPVHEGKQKFDWFSGEYRVTSSTPHHPNKTVDNGNRNQEDDYLFVIPQDFSSSASDADKLYVIVDYTIQYNDIPGATVTNTVKKLLPYNFKQGMAYTINLTIGRPIDFDVDTKITDWEDDNTIPEIPMD